MINDYIKNEMMIILYDEKYNNNNNNKTKEKNELLKWKRWSSNFFTNKKYYDPKNRKLKCSFLSP